MTKNDRERSSRIVTEATRIIELTKQINACLDRAESLDQARLASSITLAGLAGANLSAPLHRIPGPVIEAELGLIRRAGDDGIPAEQLIAQIAAATKHEITEAELKVGLGPFQSSGHIRARGNLYRPGSGRSDRRRGKKALGVPTDQEMVIEVLRASPVPIGVRAIIEAVRVRYGETIPRTSVSPLLKKLDAKGGIVVHVGDQWTIPEAKVESR